MVLLGQYLIIGAVSAPRRLLRSQARLVIRFSLLGFYLISLFARCWSITFHRHTYIEDLNQFTGSRRPTKTYLVPHICYTGPLFDAETPALAVLNTCLKYAHIFISYHISPRTNIHTAVTIRHNIYKSNPRLSCCSHHDPHTR